MSWLRRSRSRARASSARAPECRPAVAGRVAVPEHPLRSETEWFADGIVEEITTALSRFSLPVRDRAQLGLHLQGPERGCPRRRTGSSASVTFLKAACAGAGQFRVTGQLVEAETRNHVWADRYDGAMADVFELQDRITAAVAGVLEPSIRRAEIARAMRKPTSDQTAYDLYLRAMPGIDAHGPRWI